MNISSFDKSISNNKELKSLCLILGLTALATFLFNIIAIAFPPEVRSIEWRTNFLDNVSSRSIGLLLGIGFTMYGVADKRLFLRRLAIFSLVSGIIIGMASLVIIHDGLVLKEQAIANINSQAAQLVDQLESGTSDNQEIRLSSLQLQAATEEITKNQKVLIEKAKADITKASAVSSINLLIISLSLFSLSRLSLVWSKLKAGKP